MAMKPCASVGCSVLTHARYCSKHAQAKRKRADDRRSSASARGYDWRWQKARDAYLSRPENALCVMCKAQNVVTSATVVDHIKAHKGDEQKFWDETNWQPLCKRHHDSDKQRMDRGGQVQGCDASGAPTNPSHHWNC